MTDLRRPAAQPVGKLFHGLLRRAVHELRNAQNAAAVNIEALRARSGATPERTGSMQPYLDNAAQGLEDSVALAQGAIALCGALLESLAAGDLRMMDDGKRQVALGMTANDATRLIGTLGPVAARLGVAVEPQGAGVILTIAEEHEAD